MDRKFDIVIIGSGFGGLMCASVLGKHGFKVALLEMAESYGGNLQNFVRDGLVFNTGLHYIGALEEGQVLNKIFKYLGLMDRVEFERLDPECFVRIIIADRTYCCASGFENYTQRLLSYFPKEQEAINNYISLIRDVWAKNPFLNFREIDPNFDYSMSFSNTGLMDAINSITSNEELKAVLLSNNGLYAGVPGRTPFYVHALINGLFIQSAFNVKGGSARLADAFVSIIKEQGGRIFTGKKVQAIRSRELKAISSITADGDEFFAESFYSTIHPAEAIKLFDKGVFRKPFVQRIEKMSNTIGSFVLYVTLRKGEFAHIKSNIYYSKTQDVWGAVYKPEEWPKSVMMYTTEDKGLPGFAESATIITFMHYSEVAQWEDKQKRRQDGSYGAFKEERSARLFAMIEERFKGFKAASVSWFSSTPLTYFDYTGSPEGSMYGLAKDYKSGFGSYLPVTTRVSNFFITGQSVGVHGVMGVAMNSIVAASKLLDVNKLLKEIEGS